MKFLEIFFPNICPVCLECMEIGKSICPVCKEKIEKQINLNPPQFFSNKYLYGEQSVFYYEDAVKTSIANYKFKRKIGIHEFYKPYFNKAFNKLSEVFDYDYVTAVPVSNKTLITRGFDQSKLLLSDLNIDKDKKLNNLIGKKNNVKSQHFLSKEERRKNVKDAFYLKKRRPNLEDKNIILIDDIRTTGNTANEIAKLLIKREGVKNVFLFTLAKTS